MDKIKIYSRYNHLPSKNFSFTPIGESMTQQQFKEECNVNNILAKFKKTGMLTHINKHEGNFGDFSSIEDYQTSLDKIQQAHNSFNQIPSEIRNKFNNDPAKLIEFLSKKENQEDAIKYGLVIPRPQTQTQTETPKKTKKTSEPTE